MKFQEVKICGADISDFSILSDKGNASILAKVNKFDNVSEQISAKVAELAGKELPVADEMKDGCNYIVVSLYSLDVNKYTVKFENGNVYLTGSYLSIDKAVEDFLALLQKEGDVSLSEKNNVEGSLGIKIPYTKQDLLDLIKEVYEDDGRFIPGTHTWGTDYGDNNGTDIQQTVDRFKVVGSKVAPLLEIEVGKFTPYDVNRDNPENKECLTDYDISKLVSEGMKHVSEGGIMSICMHPGNPLKNHPTGWYCGQIGDDDKWDELMTEGTELNRMFMKTIDGTLRLVKAFENNGIPILFRPLHEMNGDWFWWCVIQGYRGCVRSKESMQKIWKWFYKIVTEDVGVKEALWVYSPGADGPCFIENGTVQNMVEPMYAYPGDDYVDIVGCDSYGGGSGTKSYNPNGNYLTLMASGKPAAFCEYGPSQAATKLDHPGVGLGYHYKYDCLDLLSEVKEAISDGLKIAYVMTWTWHGSLTTIGRVKELMDDPMTVSREELAERWAKLHG